MEKNKDEESYNVSEIDTGNSETKDGNGTFRRVESKSVMMSSSCEATGTSYKCTNT